MKCPHDKILIHFSKERIEAIFSTTVVREDGAISKLNLNIPAQEGDDREATLFCETGEVIEVGTSVKNIYKGDTAILDYILFNDARKLITEDQSGRTYIIDPETKYHREDNIAFSGQGNERNQIAWTAGEVEESSQLLAIIRDGELIANHPYVFLNYFPEEEETRIGNLSFTETPEIIERQILSVSELSKKKYDVKNGDIISIRTLDTFEIKLADKMITCCNDEDLLMTHV